MKFCLLHIRLKLDSRFGCVGGVLRVDAGRRCSTGDGKFFLRCSPTKGQPVDALGAQIRQLALEAKQRLRQEQAAKGQAAFNKTVPNGFTTAIDYPGVGASSRPPPIPPKSSHDAAGSEKWRRTSSTSRPVVLPPSALSQLPVDVVKTESAELRVNQGSSGGSTPAAVSDRVQETEIDGVGDDGRLESAEGQTKCETTGAVEPSEKKMQAEAEPGGVFIASPGKATMETSADASANADQCQAGLYDNVAPPELSTPGANFVSDFDATLPSRHRSSRDPRLRTSQSGTPSQPAAAYLKDNAEPGLKASSSSYGGNLTQPASVASTPATTLVSFRSASTDRVLNGPSLGGRINDGLGTGPSREFGSPASPKIGGFFPLRPGSLAARRIENAKNGIATTNGVNTTANDRQFSYDISTPISPTDSSARSSFSGTPNQPTQPSGLGGSERANSEIRRISFTNELSSVNLKGLDDVLQELRDANANVTAAVQAAARNRHYQGFASSSASSQSPPSRNTLPTTLWTPMKRES
ncbi:hypothetical protein SprV_0100406800 [Sparganum proliferum]